MIGNMAVDLVTGDLSPVIGVRVNPETNTVVPVTQSSSAHRKRKPPLGALTMLEEEIAARRSFWRRQRQREEELTVEEFSLSQQMLFSIDVLSPQKVESFLNATMEKALALNDAAKRETQRRSEAETEFSSVLPPDVTAVLTEGDEAERKGEEAHHNAHKKYIETVKKFVQKLSAEEMRFKGKLDELEDSLNPEAQRTVRQRYDHARGRLQSELKDQILSKMEALDEDHSALEYARQRAQLLTLEAKAILSGTMVVAGDYDCLLAGVYGDADLAAASTNQELVPLLKQLIGLLEGGGPFVLSPDLLNIIQGGDRNVCSMPATSPGMGGNVVTQKTTAQISSPTAPVATSGDKRSVKVVESRLVQQAPGGTSVAAVGSDMDSSALVDPIKLTKLAMTDSERKDRIRDLVTKQTYEAAKLESDLRDNEMKDINGILSENESKKATILEDLTKELRAKLSKAKSEAEREKIMMEYTWNMSRLTDALEKQKQQQLTDLRARLLDRRRQRKKNLHKTHLAEAKSQGLPPDVVPDMTIPSHDQLDLDLRHLEAQQEKLSADLNKAEAEEKSKRRPVFDTEMEAHLRALHISEEHKAAMIQQMKVQSDNREKRALELRQKLQARKERNKKREMMDLGSMSEDDKKMVLDSADAQLEADRTNEENAVLTALLDLDEVSFLSCTLFSSLHYFIRLAGGPGSGKASRVCATEHIKDPDPFIEKNRALCPSGRFSPSFIHQKSSWTEYVTTVCSRPEDGLRC